MGVNFSGYYYGPRLPNEGWEVEDDENVVYAKPHRGEEILRLLDDEEKIYKPELTLPILLSEIVSKANGGVYSGPNAYRTKWLKRVIEESKYPGLTVEPTHEDLIYRFRYSPLYADKQDLEAAQRRDGYRWGK